MPLILASASSIRRAMLEAAQVPFSVQPSTVDESLVKCATSARSAQATKLAKAKALDVSARFPGDWTLGSDSVVSVDGRNFDKPRDRAEAAEHLRAFSGKTMELTSAAALVLDGQVEWTHAETARLDVRDLSESFIQAYLDMEWPAVCFCVGVFRMEGPGVQLFDRIEGDHFAILGMPLVPLLGALRDRKLLPR